MANRIAGALIRREAETYRAQGLPGEALALLKRKLAAGLRLPPDVRQAFELQVRQLEIEVADQSAEGPEALSDAQLDVIRQGWCGEGEGPVEDLAVCAQALHAVGSCRNALKEFGLLIRRGYPVQRVVGAMADCLARLHAPAALEAAVDRLAAVLFRASQARLEFTQSLAEELVKAGFGDALQTRLNADCGKKQYGHSSGGSSP
jgi:hypothetical protein